MLKRLPHLLIARCAMAVMGLVPRPTLGAEDQKALLSLEVNAAPVDESMVIVREGDLLIAVTELERRRVRNFAGRREEIEGRSFVSLTSLSPIVTYVYDGKELKLELTIQAGHLAPTTLDLGRPKHDMAVTTRVPSAYLNYALDLLNLSTFTASFEFGASLGSINLFSTAQLNGHRQLVRGLTNVNFDQAGRLRRLTLGDTMVYDGPLGTGLTMAGITLSRNFDLDPYFMRRPTLGFSTETLSASSLEVYLNGALVRRESVPAGPLQLSNLAPGTGYGNARYVLRDAFGRVQDISSPYYLGQGLLAKGVTEYSYSLGAIRNNMSGESWNYEPLAFVGYHRHGITSRITLAGRLEASLERASGGASASVSSSFGQLDLTLAASGARAASGTGTTGSAGVAQSADAVSGAAGLGSLSYLGRRLNCAFVAQAMTDQYATLQLAPEDDRARVKLSASASGAVGERMTLGIQGAFSEYRDRGREARIGLSGNVRLTRKLGLAVNAGRSTMLGSGAGTDLFVNLGYIFGKQTHGSAGAHLANGKVDGQVEVNQTAAGNTGFGYRLSAGYGEGARAQSMVQYNGVFGIYQLGYEYINGLQQLRLNAAGSLLAIAGGGVFASRPVQSSFGLIHIDGVKSVRGYMNNQEIGRTNRHGDLIVPNLMPYYANRLSIAPDDLPLDHTLKVAEITVAPPFRGGSLATFGVKQARFLRGVLEVEQAGQTMSPALGTLTIHTGQGDISSPIGTQAEFEIEDLGTGTYAAQIDFEKGQCQFTLTIPADNDRIIELGRLTCVEPPAGAGP